jgi:Tol biopolymer transport system component
LTAEPIMPEGRFQYDVTSTSATVVVLAQVDPNAPRELYSIPIAGGQRTNLAPSLPSNTVIDFFRLTPDGQTVVFQTTQLVNDIPEPGNLFAVPVQGGSTPRRLNDVLPEGRSVLTWEIAQDSQRVIYVAGEQFGVAQLEVISTPIAAGPTVPIEAFSPPFGAPLPLIYTSADGATVVYTKAIGDTKQQLRVASTTTGAPTTIPAPDDARAFRVIGFTPDNSRIVYLAGPTFGDEGAYSTLVNGTGEVVKLSASLAEVRTITSAQISPDGTQVVMTFLSGSPERSAILRTTITGEEPLRIDPQQPFGTIEFARITPSGAHLVYRDATRFFSVPMQGNDPIVIADGFEAAATPTFLIGLTADGNYLIFRGRRIGETTYPLFLASIATTGEVQQLSTPIDTVSGPPVRGGGFLGFAVSATTNRVVFQGRAEPTGSDMAVYTVAIDEAEPLPTEQSVYLPLIRR